MNQYRQSQFEGVHMTAGQLRSLVGDQVSPLAECKLRSVRMFPDHQVVAIGAEEVRELGGTVGYGVVEMGVPPHNRTHPVKLLCTSPHKLTAGELRMLLADSSLKSADVLSAAIQALPEKQPVAIEKEFLALLQQTGHRRPKAQATKNGA